jgi:dienelactone hydrolase
VFYPAERDGRGTPFASSIRGRVPIVFIAHGNHATHHNPANRNDERSPTCGVLPPGFLVIQNHKGYSFFQRQLAQMGVIAVSVDCNETNGCVSLDATNIGLRADLIGASLAHFRSLDGGSDPIFGKRIDFSKIGLLGHSRGGEAVLRFAEAIGRAGIAGVISLAPTDIGATSQKPTGFAFMTILPAGDGDVRDNDGAKFYDRADPSPFKSQLYVHRTNHNFFNREWPKDEGNGPPRMSRGDHESVLSVFGCAFFRQVLLGNNFLKTLTSQELPPGPPNTDIHISGELAGQRTVDDHEDADISVNTLGQRTVQRGVTAKQHPFEKSAGAFNATFFGRTKGMVAQRTAAPALFRSELGRSVDVRGKEIWLRAAEVYNGSSVPAGATGFQLGLEDAAGAQVFVDSDEAGGLPRPFDRRADDIRKFGVDLTKTLLKTLRFPAACFARGRKFDPAKVRAILILLNRTEKRPLAFDQLQIVTP